MDLKETALGEDALFQHSLDSWVLNTYLMLMQSNVLNIVVLFMDLTFYVFVKVFA